MFRSRGRSRRCGLRRGAADVLPRHRRPRGPPAVLVQGRRAGLRADPRPDGAVLPELRRQRDVPVDRQHRWRTPPSRCCSSTSSSPTASACRGGRRSPTTPRSSAATRAPSSPSTSPSTTCSRTARATSTASTLARAVGRTCPTPTVRRRSPSGSACRVQRGARRRRSGPCLNGSRARDVPRARRDRRRRRLLVGHGPTAPAATSTVRPARGPTSTTSSTDDVDHVADDAPRRRPRRWPPIRSRSA